MVTDMASVILLTYKNQEHIIDSIKSILGQDYPNIELMVSDDASGVFDNDRIEKFIEENKGSNIRNVIINQNTMNMGTVAHMNLTASRVHGQYIKYIACGDCFYDHQALSKLCAYMDEKNCPVITSKSAVCNEDLDTVFYYFPDSRRAKLLNEAYGMKLFTMLCFSNIISAAGCLFHRDFFEVEKGFDESYKLLEDLPTWLRLARMGFAIPCLAEVTVFYAVGGISSTNGTAFEAKNLKPDMIQCFENEIMPYKDKFSPVKKRFITYQFLKLKDYDKYTTMSKALFTIRYFPFEAYRKGKSTIKFLIKNLRKRT